jgi:predicted RNA-binding Zn-ribbon protein involved in translation (DUF1610 family)
VKLDASPYPPRGLPQWKFYCPKCKRDGVMAWQYLLNGEPVEPESFSCPDCHVKVEILGRHDQ